MSQAFSFSTAFSGSMSHLVRGGSSVSSTEDHLEVEEFRSKRMRSTQATELNEYTSNKVFHPTKELSSACSKQTDESLCSGDHLPRAPPWLNHGGDAMYKHMSCILRLTGLSAIKSKSKNFIALRYRTPSWNCFSVQHRIVLAVKLILFRFINRSEEPRSSSNTSGTSVGCAQTSHKLLRWL